MSEDLAEEYIQVLTWWVNEDGDHVTLHNALDQLALIDELAPHPYMSTLFTW